MWCRHISKIKTIFVGPKISKPDGWEIYYRLLCKQLKAVWNDDSFGLLRLLKFLLITVQFINPFTWISSGFDKFGYLWGYLFTDMFALLKLLIPLILFNYNSVLITNVVAVYIIIDTIFYTMNIVFIHANEAINVRRTILLAILNYISITFAYSNLYLCNNLINGVTCPVQSIYFSFVVSSTVGFGDLIPSDEIGMKIVVSQIIVTIIYLAIIFSYLVSNIKKYSDKRSKSCIP